MFICIMNRIRVCLAGATGWVGRALAPAIINSPDMALVGAVSRSSAGKSLGELLSIPKFSLVVSGSVEEALKADTDILIDFTSPDSVKSNVLFALGKGVHAVVGTSGMLDKDYEEIDLESRKNGVGVIAAGNFAISAALLLHFATLAAKYMSSWEILDYASWNKVDAPSGMTSELAQRLSKVGAPEVKIPVNEIKGLTESRGATLNGSQVHSIRLPGYVIGAEAIFGRPDERLSIRYDAGSGPEPYVEGSLLAVRKVINTIGLTRGMDTLLNLKS